MTAFATETGTAVDETEAATPATASEEASGFMKAFHLDCGRKYITVDQVKELLDALSEAGYSHMELAIGNDGLRLLLDDMSVTANGTTYASDTVKSGIQSGNAAYSHSGEWSQTEMDTIIAYAKTKGIEIIPLVNTPGHMDSILAAMSACGISGAYNGSARTVDVTNSTAVAFTQALVGKYMDYFASKGCTYFNIGADEYANDVYTSGSMGWGHLINNKLYDEFIVYVNELVGMAAARNMTPIAFNDGIYFNENTSFGTFDTRLVIAAWSGGWTSFDVADTDFLVDKGHQILNTNERWYYVPGASSGYTYSYSLGNTQSVSVTTVTDNTGVAPMGAMLCVWFDYPSQTYDSCKDNILTLIDSLADNNPTYFTGPNVVLPETVTKTDDKTGISVSAPGLTELSITPVTENLPTIEGAGDVYVYDVDAFADGEAYTGEVTVSVPVPESWTRVRGGVLKSDSGEEVLGIEGTLKDGVFTFTVPHLSDVVVYEVAYDKVIELEVGGTHEFVVKGKDLSGTYTPDPAGVANVSVSYKQEPGKTYREQPSTVSMSSNGTYTGLIYNGTYYMVMDSNGVISSTQDINEATVFTVVRSGSWNYTYTISNGSRYLSVSNNSLTSSNSSYNWSYNSGFQYSSGRSTYRLICDNGTWTVSTSGTRGNLYSYTETTTDPVDESTVTFTGVAAGETYVTIDGTKYKIVVSKREESATLMVGDSKIYTDSSTPLLSWRIRMLSTPFSKTVR